VDQNGKADVNVKGFKKCCISNAVDGTDDMLWNSGAENGNGSSECEDDKGTDCGGGQ
jgi:hypothetical protein